MENKKKNNCAKAKEATSTEDGEKISDKDLMALFGGSERKEWTQEDREIINAKENPEGFYGKVAEFAKKYDEAETVVISIITRGSNAGKIGKAIRLGKDLGFNDWDLLDRYLKYLEKIKPYVKATRKFKQELFKLYSDKNFNEEHFEKAVEREYEKNKEKGEGKLSFSVSQRVCMSELSELSNYKMHNDAVKPKDEGKS